MPKSKLSATHHIRKRHVPRRHPSLPSTKKPKASLLLPQELPLTQVFISEQGIEGEVIHFQSNSKNPTNCTFSTHILFLPGNPGVLDYYKPFLQCLWQRFPANVREDIHVHGLGLPGHDLKNLNGNKTFLIADQEKYILSYLRTCVVHSEGDGCNLIFMGHSYGSYLALRILDNLKEDEYENCSFVMLMPCMYDMARCAGLMSRLVLMSTDWTNLQIWTAALMTSLVPPLLRDMVLSKTGHSKEIEQVSRTLVDGSRQRSLYSNILRLGRDEMKTIQDPRKLPAAQKVSSCLAVYAGDKDKWCPDDAQKIISEMFKERLDAQNLRNSVQHAFVLSTHETKHVADTVAHWIGDLLRAHNKKV